MKAILALCIGFLAVVSVAAAADRGVTNVTDGLMWVDTPLLPPGAKVAILYGDPVKPGELFIQRVKFPANYTIPVHTHAYDETVTLISGKLNLGEGSEFSKDKTRLLLPGAFVIDWAKHAHFAWTGDEETIIQISAIGPFGLEYVDPADDPRNTAVTKR